MTTIFLCLAFGAGGFAAGVYLSAAPAGKYAWLDKVRVKLGAKP